MSCANRKRGTSKPELAELVDLKKRLAAESPRGSAVIAMAFVEDSLGHAVRSHLSGPLTATDALFERVLRSLDAKVALALALGFVGPIIAEEIRTLAKVRNLFAHIRNDVFFDDPAIIKLCRSLRYAKACAKAKEPGRPARELFEWSSSVVALSLQPLPGATVILAGDKEFTRLLEWSAAIHFGLAAKPAAKKASDGMTAALRPSAER